MDLYQATEAEKAVEPELRQLVFSSAPPRPGKERRRPKFYTSTTLDEFPKLVEYVRDEITRRFELHDSVPDSAAWWIVERMLRRAPDRPGATSSIEERRLIAAKHLMALGDDYSDEFTVLGLNGRAEYSIRALRAVLRSAPRQQKGIPDGANSHKGLLEETKTLRMMIAACMVSNSTDQSTLAWAKPATRELALTVTMRITQYIASELAIEEVEALFHTNTKQENAQAGAVHEEGDERAPAPQLISSLADALDRPVAYYPTHLTPSKLAEVLTVSKAPWRDPVPGHESRLYADTMTYNGVPALPEMERHRRLVILGNPGAGKSTLLLARVISMLRADSQVPTIYLRFSDLGRVSDQSRSMDASKVVSGLVETFLESYSLPRETAADLTSRLLTDPRGVIALDGLDEFTAPRHLLSNLLDALAEVPGQVMISTRFNDYERLFGEWVELSVDGISAESRVKFVTSWHKAGNADSLSRALNAVSMSFPMLELPVTLGLVTWITAYEEAPVEIPGVYAQFVDIYLRGRWREAESDGRSDDEAQALFATAQSIAVHMCGLSGASEDIAFSWSD